MTQETKPQTANTWDEPRIVVFLIGLCLLIEAGLIYYQAGEQQLVVSLVTGVSGLTLFLFALLVPLEDPDGDDQEVSRTSVNRMVIEDEDRPLLAPAGDDSTEIELDQKDDAVDDDVSMGVDHGEEPPPATAEARPQARETDARVAERPVDKPLEKPVESVKPVVESAPAAAVAEAAPEPQLSWFDRLKNGLKKTRDGFVQKLKRLVVGATKIDDDLMDNLEETLYEADIGVTTGHELLDMLKKRVADEDIKDAGKVYDILKDALMKKLTQMSPQMNVNNAGLNVVLIVGVNGVGKTTTIAKLARHYSQAGKKVLLAAGDTFRAAAIDQIQIWGDRVGVEVIRGAEGGDPGALVFDAIHAAKKRDAHLLVIDTAGRLHVKANLMDELKKLRKIIAKEAEGGPHETLLVVDATTGQNAVQQAKTFNEAIEISGLIMTKLDGTAKGGVLFAVQEQVHAPLKFIGIGEKMDDLRPFEPKEFLEALFADDSNKTKTSDYQVM